MWHERMLGDSVRVNAYRRGIQAMVKPGDVVIDLGTGTGILAFMASQAGAKHVYAVDHSDFIDVAREIGARNGFHNVTFVAKNSREFTPPEMADIVLHEQIASAAFGENMVMNLLDLKQRCLKRTGRIAPAKFDVYVEPVAVRDEYLIPAIWDMDNLGFDLSFLKDYDGIQKYVGRHHGIRGLKNFEIEGFVGEPSPLMSVDLNVISGEKDILTQHEATRTALHDAPIDGYCCYFRAHFDNGVSFDNAPSSPQTNWDCLLLRQRRRMLKAGTRLHYSVDMVEVEKPRTWVVRESVE
jgi:protein arginine N-methyltransferase 1